MTVMKFQQQTPTFTTTARLHLTTQRSFQAATIMYQLIAVDIRVVPLLPARVGKVHRAIV